MTTYTPATAKPIINGETRLSDVDLYYARVAMANCLNNIKEQIRANKELGRDLFTVEDALDTALTFFGPYVREA